MCGMVIKFDVAFLNIHIITWAVEDHMVTAEL